MGILIQKNRNRCCAVKPHDGCLCVLCVCFLKQFNSKTRDGFTVNSKVPSMKDPGKEYDGFTITITGDRYCLLNVYYVEDVCVCFNRESLKKGSGISCSTS